MAAHQAPPSLGLSTQEHWNGLPFPSPMHESENEVAQSSPTLSDPMDCSLPGSSVHGIFQARVLEWGAISYSMCICAQSCPTLYSPIDCSSPGSSAYGIFQATILKWGAISYSRGSSQPRDWTHVSCLLHCQAGSLPPAPSGKKKWYQTVGHNWAHKIK